MGDQYLDWVQEDLGKIDAAFVALKAATGDRAQEVDDVFQASHDMKGQGGSYDLITAIGNQLCRMIEKVDNVGDAEVNAIEVHIGAMKRYRERNLRRYFRGDAAFAAPDIYEFLEAEGFLYAIRLKGNAVLQECIAHLLTRPVGRPPNHVRRYYASFTPWPTTSPTSCGHWSCPKRWSIGR
jgi:hypothetical protein